MWNCPCRVQILWRRSASTERFRPGYTCAICSGLRRTPRSVRSIEAHALAERFLVLSSPKAPVCCRSSARSVYRTIFSAHGRRQPPSHGSHMTHRLCVCVCVPMDEPLPDDWLGRWSAWRPPRVVRRAMCTQAHVAQASFHGPHARGAPSASLHSRSEVPSTQTSAQREPNYCAHGASGRAGGTGKPVFVAPTTAAT